MAKYFIDRNYASLTLYQFDNLSTSPKIFTAKQALVSPDLFMANRERSFWVEVKSKKRWISYGGVFETGCDKDKYYQYKHVREVTGIKLYLVFNHKEIAPLGFYFIDIEKPVDRFWDGKNAKTGAMVQRKPMALWRLEHLTPFNKPAPKPFQSTLF